MNKNTTASPNFRRQKSRFGSIQWLKERCCDWKCEIVKLLKIANRKPTVEERQTGVFGVNMSTPLIQTLCFLENHQKIFKSVYFKQIAFIHYGRDHSNDDDDENEENKHNYNNDNNNNNDSNEKNKENAKKKRKKSRGKFLADDKIIIK